MYKASFNWSGKVRALFSWVRHNLRYVRIFLKGLPALATAVGVLVLAGIATLYPREQLLAHYNQQAAEALANRDLNTARIGYERLAQLDPGRPGYRFGLAIALYAIGQKDQAIGLMDGLAKPGELGFVPAHLWQARRLLGGKPVPARDVQKHLAYVLQEQPQNLEAHSFMGQAYLLLGQQWRARDHLEKAVSQYPDLGLAVARIYAAENRRQGALAYAEMAERFFRDKLKANKDDQTARLYLAETLIFMERFAEGIALLQDGYDTANSDPYRLALANAYLRWAQFAALQPGSTLSFRLALLEKTLQLDCSNMEALYSLLAITRLQRRTVYVPPPNLVGILVTPLVPRLERLAADRARADMQELLANGESPATAHLILGMEAQGRGKQTEARVHFEQSYKLDPHMPVIVNNLAWSLTHVQPVDLDRALLLINDLLERWPKQLNYRETRGQILTRQGKWKEALTDLEAALPAMRFSRELHAALALCYDKLGVPEMRDQHRKFLPTSPVGLLP